MTLTKADIDKLHDDYRHCPGNNQSFSVSLGCMYVSFAENVYKEEQLLFLDKEAASTIARLKKYISDLTKWRQLYAERYNELCTLPSVPVVKLIRHHDYRTSRIIYTLTTCRRFDDGHEIDAKSTNYNGKSRKQALADFDSYVKEHPGIIAEKDIEKKSWER